MAEKFLPFRVWVRRNPGFLWEFNGKIGIDRRAVAMDTSMCGVKFLSLSFYPLHLRRIL